MVVVEALELEKRFGSYPALRRISFRVEGNIICILGPNGSGKTTLLSIMAGLRRPSRGVLRVNNVEPYRERRVFSRYSFMFERPRLPLNIRVSQVVNIIGGCEYDDLFYGIGLKEILDRKLYALSMGEAQLVGLYVSLCKRAELIILDEPFAHLDFKRASILMDLVSQVGGKASVVFTTHSPEEAELLSDSMLVLEAGRLKWSGETRSLFREGFYEVLVSPRERRIAEKRLRDAGARFIYCAGGYCFVSSVEEGVLSSLVREGLVLGYRLMGVRGYYAGLEA